MSSKEGKPTTMMSPWEWITDAAYKQWQLDTPLTDSEYNEASIVDRRALLTQYQGLQQQQNPKGMGHTVSIWDEHKQHWYLVKGVISWNCSSHKYCCSPVFDLAATDAARGATSW